MTGLSRYARQLAYLLLGLGILAAIAAFILGRPVAATVDHTAGSSNRGRGISITGLKRHARRAAVLLLGLAVLAAFATAVPAANAAGNVYYVATNGSDSNSGSISAPFRTVQKAVGTAGAGDTIYLRAGTYNESVTISRSGASGSPITLANYNGEAATINGGASVAIRTSGAASYWTVQGLSISSTNRYTMQLGFWGGSENTTWVVRNNHIYGSAVTKGSNQLFEGNNVDGVYPDGSKYGTYSGQNQGDAGLMDIDGSHNNTFRGNNVHDFANSNARGIWTQGYTHDDLIEGNTVTNIKPTSGIGQSIDLDGAGTVEWNHTVRGNRVNGNNYVGIQLENVFNSVVEDNVVQNTGDAGIIDINYDSNIGCPAVGTRGSPYGDSNGNGTCKDELTNNTIEQNLITSGSWPGGYGGIVFWGARATRVLANTIYSSGSGVSVNYQAQVSYSDRSVLKGNVLASGNGVGVCSQGDFSIFSEDDHNLLYGGGQSTVYATGSGCSTRSSLSSYQSSTGKGSGSIQANPLFVSAGSDFHLQSTSPAIDKSVSLGLTADLDGVARPQGAGYDIGAYERPASGSAPAPTQTAIPTATQVPPTPTRVPSTATPLPPTPTRVPPTATSLPSTPTPVPPTATPVPSPTPAAGSLPVNQFRVDYISGMDPHSGTVLYSGYETSIDHDWGTSAPAPGVPADLWSATWNGQFDFQGGNYVFSVTADDGIRVWVDQQLIIDGWRNQAATTYTASVSLSAGRHAVAVDYYEANYFAVAKLSWALQANPTPAPTNVVAAAPTSMPTSTQIPPTTTATPVPPKATQVPPTATLVPTGTPVPTATPVPMVTPVPPTATLMTPAPTATAVPTATSKPAPPRRTRPDKPVSS